MRQVITSYDVIDENERRFTMAKAKSVSEPVKNKIFLNGVEVDKIPEDALKVMSERLSRVVSNYFARHPDEYIAYMEWLEKEKGVKVTVD